MTQSPENTKLAAYHRIEASLRDKIQGRVWPVGTMLPGRRDLAREYGVSSVTLDRAVARLIKDGLLRADDRRGTFVARTERLIAHPTAPLGISQDWGGLPGGVFSTGATLTATRQHATVAIIAPLYLADEGHLALHNSWVRQVVQSLEHSCSTDGHITQFFNCVQEPGLPVVPLGEAVEAVLDVGADAVAVIALGENPANVDKSLHLVASRDIPIVCVTNAELRRPVAHVFYDNRSAGYEAADHLLRRGHRTILFFAPFTAFWVEERLTGVRAAVEHHGLSPDAVQVYPHCPPRWRVQEDPFVLGYAAARAAFEAAVAPSAVVSVNDGVSFGYLRAAHEAGRTVGSDPAIISFDDHPEARSLGLTSMRPPMEAMGKEAARLLVRALHGEHASTQVRCRGHLLPRSSTHGRQAGSRTR